MSLDALQVNTEVLDTGPAHYSQVGVFSHYPLSESSSKISQPLARRLVSYAEDRIKNCGLHALMRDWRITVGTLDGKERLADDRNYYVEFTNTEETKISVVGIMIRSGKPFLDHGLEIETS